MPNNIIGKFSFKFIIFSERPIDRLNLKNCQLSTKKDFLAISDKEGSPFFASPEFLYANIAKIDKIIAEKTQPYIKMLKPNPKLTKPTSTIDLISVDVLSMIAKYFIFPVPSKITATNL